MPIADWSVPFILHSSVYSLTDLDINVPVSFAAGTGIYRLRPDACHLRNNVRSVKENVPQEDGSILHRRYLTGSEMDLAVQFWAPDDALACDELLQEMTDSFMGYAYGLLNAGDDQGRVLWLPDGDSSAFSSYRMLDDIRLLSYPVESGVTPYELTLTVDCGLPYSEDFTQDNPSIPGTATNYGNRPTYPVMKLYGTFSGVTVTNTTTGSVWQYDGTLPGAATVTSPNYLEVNVFNNTVYLNGSGANRMAGVIMTTSDFFSLVPGNNTITVSYTGGAGGASLMLVNGAWA